MKRNMGNADRIIRVLVAALIAVLFFSKAVTGTPAYIFLAVAGIFVLTSMAGSCPLYSALGINTCTTVKK